MASTQLRAQAEARLAQAAAEAGCADPRPPLRDRLRELKETHAATFEKARAHYEGTVLPALAGDADPLQAWAEYARFIGELAGPGRLVAIDATGRATPHQQPGPGLLVLFIPDENGAPALVALAPAAPAAAQQATVDLLVRGRLSL